jgi:hypothetical protein
MKRRIAPGIWEDLDGAIHYSAPELMELFEMTFDKQRSN